MKVSNKHKRSIILLLAGLAMGGSFFQQTFFVLTGEYLYWIGWISDVLIIVGALIIRFNLISATEFNQLMKSTDAVSETFDSGKVNLHPERFLNFMPLAIIIGTVASVSIHYQFLIGMGVYLVMHVVLMYAFSGIIHLQPQFLFSKPMRKCTYFFGGMWLIILVVVFTSLILPGLEGAMIWIVLVYVIFLIMMCAVTYLHIPYRSRSRGFRLGLAAGATSFVFSDTIIGYTVFTNTLKYAPLLHQPTYILALALLTLAVIFRKDRAADKPEKSVN